MMVLSFGWVDQNENIKLLWIHWIELFIDASVYGIAIPMTSFEFLANEKKKLNEMFIYEPNIFRYCDLTWLLAADKNRKTNTFFVPLANTQSQPHKAEVESLWNASSQNGCNVHVPDKFPNYHYFFNLLFPFKCCFIAPF